MHLQFFPKNVSPHTPESEGSMQLICNKDGNLLVIPVGTETTIEVNGAVTSNPSKDFGGRFRTSNTNSKTLNIWKIINNLRLETSMSHYGSLTF